MLVVFKAYFVGNTKIVLGYNFGINNVYKIEQNLNKMFGLFGFYDWFVDNKLSIHFRDKKTKY